MMGKDLAMQRYLTTNGLEMFKSMVKHVGISPTMALGLLANAAGHFSGNNDTPDYKNFVQNSGLIYVNEPFFNIGYKYDFGMYNFIPASRHNVHLLYKLYQHLSGKEYASPEQLIVKNINFGTFYDVLSI